MGAAGPAKSLVYCFDIDGTLCTNTWGKYENARPLYEMIRQVNALYDHGHRSILFTARGTAPGIDWRAVTEAQMRGWGVQYHELPFGKPQADVYIDDRAMSLAEWAQSRPPEAQSTEAMALEIS